MPVEGSLGHVPLGLTLPKLPCCRRLRHCLFSAAPIGHFILRHAVHTVPSLECDPHPVGNLIMRPLTAHFSTSASSCIDTGGVYGSCCTLFTQHPSILCSCGTFWSQHQNKVNQVPFAVVFIWQPSSDSLHLTASSDSLHLTASYASDSLHLTASSDSLCLTVFIW